MGEMENSTEMIEMVAISIAKNEVIDLDEIVAILIVEIETIDL
jgi:hypothetical protein